ncbi:MAG: hypothetical protein U9N35_08830, partial [Euryarchaeota archaeon]|nr:hypothetical protein [Euryarchaeota archaeon]
EIRNMGYDVDREWGTDRDETAANVAIHLWGSSKNVVIINGNVPESFLIALSSSYKLKAPILLVDENKVPEATKRAVERLGPENIYLIGPGIPDVSELPGEKKYIGTDIEVSELPRIGRNIAFDYLSIFLGILIGGALVFLMYSMYRRTVSIEVPLFVLTEAERKIVDAMKEEDGELKQQDLPEKTGFSRPKVTKLIQDLEHKEIISRLKYGKTYKVKIEKKFVKR